MRLFQAGETGFEGFDVEFFALAEGALAGGGLASLAFGQGEGGDLRSAVLLLAPLGEVSEGVGNGGGGEVRVGWGLGSPSPRCWSGC